jgi:hypothetical protein
VLAAKVALASLQVVGLGLNVKKSTEACAPQNPPTGDTAWQVLACAGCFASFKAGTSYAAAFGIGGLL